jgi:hypothetical protein
VEYHLKQKDVLIGTLRSVDIDFPWINCKFEPTEAFQPLKHLFDAEVKVLNVDPFDLDEWEAAYGAIEALNLDLQCHDNGEQIEGFLLHIQADDAWFRY